MRGKTTWDSWASYSFRVRKSSLRRSGLALRMSSCPFLQYFLVLLTSRRKAADFSAGHDHSPGLLPFMISFPVFRSYLCCFKNPGSTDPSFFFLTPSSLGRPPCRKAERGYGGLPLKAFCIGPNPLLLSLSSRRRITPGGGAFRR